MGKFSDDKNDEAQVRDELEPELSKLSELTQASTFLATGEDPQSYEEAIGSIDQDKWRAAMQTEMDTIVSVVTFKLVPAP